MYHTLVSVNNIDQDQFKSDDQSTVSRYWFKVFIQNNISSDTYDAIAGKSGAALQAARDSVRILFEQHIANWC